MHRLLLIAFLTFFAGISGVYAAPTIAIERYDGETSGKYIVTFKSSSARRARLSALSGVSDVVEWDLPTFNGFAAYLDNSALETLRASPDVASISEDGIVYARAAEVQKNAPWGLQRISTAVRVPSTSPVTGLNFNYTFQPTAGQDVDIYVLDTGIYLEHSDFGGRARWGLSVNGYPNRDGHGHGTHVAATIAGKNFGVAKKSSLIAVKVLDDAGSGTVSGVITGLVYAAGRYQQTRRTTIVNLSLGGGSSTSFDDAINAVIDVGVHVVLSGNTSPPSRPNRAVIVGSINNADACTYTCAAGLDIHIFAPGVNVVSAWIGGANSAASLSGVSSSTAHISGLLAYILSIEGNTTPDGGLETLISHAQMGAITGLPRGANNNYLAHNSCDLAGMLLICI